MKTPTYFLLSTALFLLAGLGGGCAGPGEAVEGTSSEGALTQVAATTIMPGTLPAQASEPPPQATSVLKTPDATQPASPTATEAAIVDPDTVYPEAEIHILKPGPYSRVASPFRLSMNLEPGYLSQVRIELYGEDGRPLVRQLRRFALPPGVGRLDLAVDVEFEIEAVAELGRLEVSIDDEYGRPKALASAYIILLSEGLTDLNPPGDLQENIVIQHPYPNVMIRGESVVVSGLARTQSDRPLEVELIDRDGKVRGAAVAYVLRQEGADYGLFAAEVDFNVSQPTWVRVIVRETGDQIPGSVHLSSLETVISPRTTATPTSRPTSTPQGEN